MSSLSFIVAKSSLLPVANRLLLIDTLLPFFLPIMKMVVKGIDREQGLPLVYSRQAGIKEE